MKSRIPHRLKGNERTYIPTKFIFFDTETSFKTTKKGITSHKLKLGWSCYWHREKNYNNDVIKWYDFKTSGRFWDIVESCLHTKDRLVLISHNIVFDFTIVNGWIDLIDRGWKLTRLYEKGRTFISKYVKGSRTILILDNMNFFLTSVENLGTQIGYKKLKVDFNNCTDDELSIYCKRDVEIILKTWQEYFKWFTVNDLGNFGVTISSQSFNTYRHRFMKADIFIHNRKYVTDLERQSYFGGRTECFKIGSFNDDTYYYLDINSMYPAVMKDNYYPCKYLTYDKKCDPVILGLYLKKYCVIARVIVRTDKPFIPIRGKIISRNYNLNYIDKIDPAYKDLTNWIVDKGKIKPEYIKVKGKYKVLEEYKYISSYLKSKDGIPIDELASSLLFDRPDLYNYFNIGRENLFPGDRLREVLLNSHTVDQEINYMLDREEKIIEDKVTSVIKDDVHGRVIFPVGEFETVLATPEIALALKENVIVKVLSVALYEKDHIFKDFIDFFYQERLKAKENKNTAYDLFFKILMNSLYGKFGQMMGEWETVGKCDPKEVDYWTQSLEDDSYIYKYRKINGLIQRYNKKREAFNSFPAISSHVTSYARVKLWTLIEIAKMENVYYCDTDSIFVNQSGYDNLRDHISDLDLGKLKVECVTDDMKILGCKQYIFKEKVKHKGLKKDAVKISDNTYMQTQWSTLKTLIINKNLHDYQVKDVIKQFTGIYDKGIVQVDGIVKPLVL